MKYCLLVTLLAGSLAGVSQDFSNKGKDFWIGYGNHVRMFNLPPGSGPERMQLYITSDVNTSGLVEIPGLNFTTSFNVTANQITTIDIPRTAALVDEGMFSRGIHVRADKPVVVYSFIYVNAISGATVCLPTNTLGREYYSINYKQASNESNSYSYFFAVAADTGTTTVEITPAVNTKGGRPGGVPFRVNLTRGEVYQVLAFSDLTGSIIRSVNTGSGCKRIAVFCGSGKISIGCSSGTGTSDNLYQQMYPASTWGKTYITVPTINSPQLASQINHIRIFRSDPGTVVRRNGVVINSASFVNGEYVDFEDSRDPSYIEADKPILVAQYFTSQGCGGNSGDGDPDMIYLNPVEQTINNVTLNSMQPAANTNINQHFINVVIKNTPDAINGFKIDGISYASSFTVHPHAPGYAFARIQVNRGTHNLTSDTAFNAIAYGFGNAESYGYSAGTNLKDLYQFVSISNNYATVNFPAACRNSPFKFHITFPYQASRIAWHFSGLFADTTVLNPIPDSSWQLSGRTLYRYTLSKLYTVPNIGTYPIRLVVVNPSADGCTGEQEVEYDLEVFEKPSANFTITSSGCLADSVLFTGATDPLGRQVIRWNWSFGDGQLSGARLPKHLYTSIGPFTVRHSVITDVGCLSDTVSKVVALKSPPSAKFGTTSLLCEKNGIQFRDSSFSEGTQTQWKWDMGDGTVLNRTSNAGVLHTYDTAGTFVVKLEVQDNSGCKSSLFTRSIQINHLPKVNFGLPEVCLLDPVSQFTDSTTAADGNQSFSYLWRFNDPNANATNPDSSAQQNPQHRFSASGYYNIELNVWTASGCSSTAQKQFTVNGATPQSAFSIVEASCSNQPVVIRDGSSVDFGSIVKVEIYWDYFNDPTIKTVDENPSNGKTYQHVYPDFASPATRHFQIRYVAYSGINCISQSTQNITLQASPDIQFTNLPALCEEEEPFMFTAAREISGLSGTGEYSGRGISNGMFNPQVAGDGLHSIRYTFTATNGCKSFQEQSILVWPTPEIDAGPDRTVLEGGSIVIEAKARGSNLAFTWTPTISIDSPSILTPRVSPAGDVTYFLKALSSNGCEAMDDVNVKVLKEPKIPNAFSPNGDGVNDTWIILFLNSYPGCTVDVFNRYGQKVFSSVGYDKPWDGTVNGQHLPVGTYYYVIHPKNGRQSMSGSVTILR